MRKAVLTVLWLFVVLAVPVSASLDAACRLAHAQATLAASDHAEHHHPDDPDHAPGDHHGGVACCHMTGTNVVGLPTRIEPLAASPSGARAAYARIAAELSGHDPTPPRDPPRT